MVWLSNLLFVIKNFLIIIRDEEARESLQWYRGSEYDITQEIEEIIEKRREKADQGKVNLAIENKT